MRKLLGGASLCGIALVGSVALTGPTSAGGPPTDLSVDKAEVGRGDVVTVSSIEPCGGSAVHITVNDPHDVATDVEVVPNDDGSWAFEWLVLETEPSGYYGVDAECYFDGTVPAEPYDSAIFRVVEYPAEAEGLQMTITPEVPNEASPGSAVTLRSVSPCPATGVDRVVGWFVFNLTIVGDEVIAGDILDAGLGNLSADGSWTATFAAPDTENVYGVGAACGRTGYEENEAGEIEAYYVTTGWYDAWPLLVGPGAEVPPGPIPPIDELPQTVAPSPARPVAGKPSLTG